MNNSEKLSESREKLINDMKSMKENAEEMLESAGEQASSKYESARARFRSTMHDAKGNFNAAQERLVTGSKDAMDTADQYVHEKPWQAVGIGAIAGLLVGLLLHRK
ncbi:DUF883 family protein [Noviherbaspirillum cavernae]|uniref:DUF883 family protein n=1 Tax=Noviherbaspirillum cavernae TaxID=2320862 RepID=A0A418X3U0_9BURK|nr:DUF883 family protein [Noviherbaspirillum cavernae]RJG07123.1 DUF883 family protein [Noviherbaspirillum cavernae]